jgi:hypothetical protein
LPLPGAGFGKSNAVAVGRRSKRAPARAS